MSRSVENSIGEWGQPLPNDRSDLTIRRGCWQVLPIRVRNPRRFSSSQTSFIVRHSSALSV